MKKFTFSLSHMRDYKDWILDEELGVLHQLKSEQDRIERRIDQLEREFARLSAEMQREEQKGTTIAKIQTYSMQLGSIRMQLRELRAELKKAIQKVEQQTKVVIAANQEVSKLDKLQDKQYEAYRERAAKAEELRIEELVTLGLSRDAV